MGYRGPQPSSPVTERMMQKWVTEVHIRLQLLKERCRNGLQRSTSVSVCWKNDAEMGYRGSRYTWKSFWAELGLGMAYCIYTWPSWNGCMGSLGYCAHIIISVSVLTWSTVSLCQHDRLSLCADMIDCQPVLTWSTVNLCWHDQLSVCAEMINCQSVINFQSVLTWSKFSLWWCDQLSAYFLTQLISFRSKQTWSTFSLCWHDQFSVCANIINFWSVLT